MSDDLVHALRDSKGWPTLGHAAADRIEELEAELAYYRGVHDGIYNTGTHVVVERTQMSDYTIKVVNITDHDDGSATIVVDLDTEATKLIMQVGLRKLLEDHIKDTLDSNLTEGNTHEDKP